MSKTTGNGNSRRKFPEILKVFKTLTVLLLICDFLCAASLESINLFWDSFYTVRMIIISAVNPAFKSSFVNIDRLITQDKWHVTDIMNVRHNVSDLSKHALLS